MITEQDFVVWEDRFSVDIPIIDNQHKRLITMTNDLHKACLLSDSVEEQFRKTVRDAVYYVKYHFTTEEEIMVKTAYPGYLDHKRIHTEFAQEVLKNALYFDERKKYAPHQFVRFLRNWVLSHVALVDSCMGEYLVGLQRMRKLCIIIMETAIHEDRPRVCSCCDL